MVRVLVRARDLGIGIEAQGESQWFGCKALSCALVSVVMLQLSLGYELQFLHLNVELVGLRARERGGGEGREGKARGRKETRVHNNLEIDQ